MTEFTELGKYPSDDAEAGDRAVLDQLAQHGADLSKETEFIHFLYFDDEASTRAVVDQLGQIGYRGGARQTEDGAFVIQAERDEVPSMENVRRMRQFMETIAAHFGGEYDGWEAAVTK
jgi:regulator of ribonuclease activity B